MSPEIKVWHEDEEIQLVASKMFKCIPENFCISDCIKCIALITQAAAMGIRAFEEDDDDA